jgi:hypothetical protein
LPNRDPPGVTLFKAAAATRVQAHRSIHKEIVIDVAVEKVWAAIRDYGAVIKSVADPLVKWTERHASLRSKMAGSPENYW